MKKWIDLPFKNKNVNCSSRHKLKWTPNTRPFLGKALTCSALGSEAFDDHFHFLLHQDCCHLLSNKCKLFILKSMSISSWKGIRSRFAHASVISLPSIKTVKAQLHNWTVVFYNIQNSPSMAAKMLLKFCDLLMVTIKGFVFSIHVIISACLLTNSLPALYWLKLRLQWPLTSGSPLVSIHPTVPESVWPEIKLLTLVCLFKKKNSKFWVKKINNRLCVLQPPYTEMHINKTLKRQNIAFEGVTCGASRAQSPV